MGFKYWTFKVWSIFVIHDYTYTILVEFSSSNVRFGHTQDCGCALHDFMYKCQLA